MPDDLFALASSSLHRAYRDVAWETTRLGPPSSWSPVVRGATALALQTCFPVALFLGPELEAVYNDAFIPLIAAKHPVALGRPAHDIFPEAWEAIGPLMEDIMSGEGATWVEDALVPLHRQGFLEDAYFTFSYSPVRGAGGRVEGLMNIATETTRQVVDRRRLRLLARLGDELAAAANAEEIAARAVALLRADPQDLRDVDIRPAGGLPGPGDGQLPEAPRTPVVDDLRIEDEPGGPVAWVPLAAAADPPMLVARLSERLAADSTYQGFLRLIGAALGQALARVGAHAAERSVATTERLMSMTLQRSLLGRPVEPNHLQVAVRYRPAAEQAEVGGDWYDAFVLPDRSLTMVVGDVAGHDRDAAAAMGQVRNLLRGVAYTLLEPPAQVLAVLDDAMRGLAVDVYATAVLAKVEQSEAEAERGLRTLRWSNAGHPPPVVIEPAGGARLLQAQPDLLLGVGDGSDARVDHEVTLHPGATVVLYTDGLIERRDAGLDEGLAWLAGALDGKQDLTAEQLCDHLLDQIDGDLDDDVALLVLRAHPVDEPRPPEAGPRVLPSHLHTGGE